MANKRNFDVLTFQVPLQLSAWIRAKAKAENITVSKWLTNRVQIARLAATRREMKLKKTG